MCELSLFFISQQKVETVAKCYYAKVPYGFFPTNYADKENENRNVATYLTNFWEIVERQNINKG